MDSNKCFQIGDLIRFKNESDVYRVTRVRCHPWFENGYRGDTSWFEGAINKTYDRVEAQNTNPASITFAVEAHEHFFERVKAGA